MPPDGSAEAGGSLPSDPARSPSRAERRKHVRARIRRFLIVAHGITAAAHVVPIVGASVVFGWVPALLVGVLVCVTTAARLQALIDDPRRSRLVTHLFDEPVLAHWFASVLATALFPAFALASASWGALSRGPFERPYAVAALASYGAAALVSAWGVWGRRRFVRVAFVDIPIPGLAAELDGYTIAHLTDLHIGSYDSKERGFEWAARVNGLAPDLVAVTGDLVTAGTRYYDDVAEVLAELRAKDGVVVSMGNHDQWDPDRLCASIEAKGPAVLRNASRVVRRGAAELFVAGIDDWSTGQDDLPRALDGRPGGAPAVLLSHFPEFFPEAARRGVDLVLSGHTHGGQIAVPFVARRLNLSRLARQPVHGLHVRGRSRLYLNTGLGTTGPPLRLGVPPEIAVLVLRKV